MPVQILGEENTCGSFDYDGTLAEWPLLVQNFIQAGEILRLPAEPVIRHIGLVRKGARLPLDLDNTPFMVWPELEGDPNRHARFVKEFHAIEIKAPYRMIEGALATLEWLNSRGVGLFLSTSNKELTIWEKLRAIGIPPSIFRAVVTRDGAYVKPHPQAIVPILRQFGYEPEQCFHIGDSLDDIKFALDSGMQFIGVLTGVLDEEGFRQHGVEESRILPSVAGLWKLAA